MVVVAVLRHKLFTVQETVYVPEALAERLISPVAGFIVRPVGASHIPPESPVIVGVGLSQLRVQLALG